jgi:hypothetical protein
MTCTRRIEWLCEKAELIEGSLTEWERQFVDSIQHRLAHMGDAFEPTERQMEVLERIANK